jgi:non-specific serine/threonine protein kinase
LEVALLLRHSFNDGCWFVDLSALRDPDLVPIAISQVLGIRDITGMTAIERLCHFLKPRTAMLILDNFEQVSDAAGDLATLLASSPGLTLLVTSRIPLNLAVEQRYPVSPLDLPAGDTGSRQELDLVQKSSAIQLFCRKAQAVHPAFTLTEGNAAAVAEICARLDGLPLAIELAAARSNILPPRDVLARLDHSLGLLTGGSRDMPSRHHSLRDAIAWSYELLDEAGQRLFRRLVVFAGGFTESAAIAIAGDATASSLSIFDQLSKLVEQNLLTVRPADDGVPRFTMLETIREYGLQRLEASGEECDVRAAHASWCLELMQQAFPFWCTSEQLRISNKLESEHDNLRAALTWLSDSGDHAGVVRLTGLAWPFWFFRSHLTEGSSWLQLALRLSSGERSIERLRVLVGAGCLWFMRGDHRGARAWNEEGLNLARNFTDLSPNDTPYNGLAIGAHFRGEYEEGERWNREALRAFRSVADTMPNAEPMVSVILSNMADVAFERGEIDRARSLAGEALEMQRARNFSWAACNSLYLLARIAENTGNGAQATALYRESFQYAADHRDLRLIARHIDHYASIDAAAERFDQVPIWLGAGQQLHDRLGGQVSADRQESLDRAARDAKTVLGEQAFDLGWRVGVSLSLDELMAVAAQIEVSGRPSVLPADAVKWGLTRRELDVLCLVAEGWTDREIANTLFISRRTVSTHVSRLLAKLGVRSRRQAVTRARDCSLLASCVRNSPQAPS